MIEVCGVFKKYGKQDALKGITFNVPQGSILGIAGANGAGKSTLFDILATLDRKYKGEVVIEGLSARRDYYKIRRILGYVPGNFSLYPDLTIMENISFFAQMYGSKPISYCESPFWESLKDFSNTRADRLSGGMKQKLSIICAMVHSPKILLLDEPTTGIDYLSRKAIWEELKKLKERGITIIASTHYYEEFNYMDTLLLLHEGNELLYSSIEDIRGDSEGSDVFYQDFLSRCLIQL
ncbi:MAG: ABC transporter ATP-binding protein [Bacteroidales bacterium]|jgi:ABC-type multidrug transport system ATPase subunit|nr:ABC transporter ATP-binding protein [Bacteroidales bacterium]